MYWAKIENKFVYEDVCSRLFHLKRFNVDNYGINQM